MIYFTSFILIHTCTTAPPPSSHYCSVEKQEQNGGGEASHNITSDHVPESDITTLHYALGISQIVKTRGCQPFSLFYIPLFPQNGVHSGLHHSCLHNPLKWVRLPVWTMSHLCCTARKGKQKRTRP